MIRRPIVYIAHPLSGDWEGNIASARQYAEASARNNYAPVAPYLTLYGLLHEPADRQLGLDIDLAMIEVCDEVWLCGGRISSGMQIELDHALEVGVKIRSIPHPDGIRDMEFA